MRGGISGGSRPAIGQAWKVRSPTHPHGIGNGALRACPGKRCLRDSYRRMFGGNIGASPYDPAEDSGSGDFDYRVIEVSSYQATDLPYSPPVVAVTALHPDRFRSHPALGNGPPTPLPSHQAH